MITPSQYSVLHVLAYQALWNGKCIAAESIYRLLLQLSPDALDVRSGLACAQIRNGKPEDALQTLQPISTSPDPAIQLLLGKTFSMLGDTDRALQAMEVFCTNRPAWQMPVLMDSDETGERPVRNEYA